MLAAIALVVVVGVAWHMFAGGGARGDDGSTPSVSAGVTPAIDSVQPPAEDVASARFAVENAMSPTEPTATPMHRLVGVVVDESRRRVAGARVELRSLELTASFTTSDANGAFALEMNGTDVELRVPLRVGATSVEGHSGSVRLWHDFSADADASDVVEIDVGRIVVGPTHSLFVRVVGPRGSAAGARVRVELGHRRVFLTEEVADEQGELVVERIEAGPVHVTAFAPGYEGRVRTFVPESNEVVVALEPLRTATVVVLDAETLAPIAGAEVELVESLAIPAVVGRQHDDVHLAEYLTYATGSRRTFVTGESGEIEIEGLCGKARLSVRVTAPGHWEFPGRLSPGSPVVAGGERLRVELTPHELRTVRWPIVAHELPVPPNGTPLSLRWMPGTLQQGRKVPELPGPAYVENGAVTVENVPGNASYHAATPDGALTRLWASKNVAEAKEVSFRRPRHVDVVVTDADGAPVAGAEVAVRNLGNNELAPALDTDAEGHAVVGGLYGGRAQAYVSAPGEEGFGESAGSVDLDAGDARIEYTLVTPTYSRVRLAVTCDGQRRLPARFRVSTRGGAWVVEEDPDLAELVVELGGVGPGDDGRCWLSASGFLPGTAEFTLPDDGSDAFTSVELVSGTLLVAHVGLPEEGGVGLNVQRLNDAGEWSTPVNWQMQPLRWPNGPDDSFMFEGLTPGAWRVRDERSDVASEPVDVLPGDREAHVTIDLGGLEWVTGRVEVDDPAELERVRVLGGGHDGGLPSKAGGGPPLGTRLRGDTFRLRVPADREVELVAWHPWLAAREGVGRVRVRGGRDGVVLRLVSGDELQIPTPWIERNSRRKSLRVGRFAGESRGAPLEWHYAPIDEGIARCGVPRGRWTFWVDPMADGVPFVLPDIEVNGVTKVATPQLSPGSSILVRILVREGQSAPRVYVRAQNRAEPSYDRQINSRGEHVLQLSGLDHGTFDVSVFSGLRGSSLEREVLLDGTTDVELELDLR